MIRYFHIFQRGNECVQTFGMLFSHFFYTAEWEHWSNYYFFVHESKNREKAEEVGFVRTVVVV